MSQPIPPGPYTRLCVVCYTAARKRPASAVTYRGRAVCDEHGELSEAEVRAALHPKRGRP
jgi:hypothetical protein